MEVGVKIDVSEWFESTAAVCGHYETDSPRDVRVDDVEKLNFEGEIEA